MYRPRHRLALATLLCLLANGSFASDSPAPPPDPAPSMHPRHHHAGPPTPEDMTKRMAADLGLTPEQVDKVRAINEKHVAEMRALMPSEEEMRVRREKIERIRTAQDAALKAVLTPEQYASFRASGKEHAKHRSLRRHHDTLD